MLYRLGTGDTFKALQPVAFMDLADMGMVEKDLENLLAANLLDVLFEESELMPIFQERALQVEADLYALDRAGQLWIFELKRGHVGSDAMLQALEAYTVVPGSSICGMVAARAATCDGCVGGIGWPGRDL